MPHVIADTRAVDIGVDLSGCYVIEVNPQHVNYLTYNTNSQSGVRMQYGDVDATHRIYYVSASNEPTSITVSPIIEKGVNYGIRSITDDSGKTYQSAPRRTVIKTSELTVGKIITVNTEPLENITTAKLVIRYNNPQGLSTENLVVTSLVGSHYNLYFSYSDFVDNQLEIPYDPLTENYWCVQNTEKMFVARLDGKKKITRSLLLTSGASGTKSNYAFTTTIGEAPGTHTLDVYASVIPMDIPMRFEFENTTGNETNPDYLSGMIESISINGETLTDKSWLQPDFKVPNGSKIVVKIKQQLRGSWEMEKAWFNGNSLFNAGTTCEVETDDPNDVQVYKIRGLYNSPWRYTLNMTNPTRTKLEVNGSQVLLPENASVYEGKGGYSSPALRPMGKNSTSEENPLAVYDVVVDGKTITLDDNGCYYPKEMDEVITVTPREYKREMPIQLYCNLGYYSNYTITLDPTGQTKKYVPLQQGWQTIMVNPKDLPFGTYSDDAAIYINGSQTPLTEQEGYGIFTGTKNLTADSKVKLYTSRPRELPVRIDVASALSCTIYADGEQITTGQHVFLEGTELLIVPTQKTGLVLEKSDGTYINQESDGNFKLEITTSENYTLHRENAKITISCPSEKNIYVQNPVTNTKTLLKGRTKEPYTLHYDADPNQTYTLKFFDPTGKYRVSNITATPSSGFSFDPSSATAKGIKDGMNLNLEISEYVRPYSYDIWVSPHFYTEGDESELSVIYMENGEQKLEKLLYGDNKKELSADNFPIIIGPYKVELKLEQNPDPSEPAMPIEEIVLDDSYYSQQKAYIGGIYQEFNGYTEGITITEPQAVVGRIYHQYDDSTDLYIDNPNMVNFSYSVNGDPLTQYQAPSYWNENVTTTIYPRSYFTAYVDPSADNFDIMELVLQDNSTNPATITKAAFDTDGYARIDFPSINDGFNTNGYNKTDSYEVFIALNLMSVDFLDVDGNFASLEIYAGGQKADPTDMMELKYLFRPMDEIYIKPPVDRYAESLQIITGVYDPETGEDLNYDQETGRLTGLSKYIEAGEAHLALRREPFEQNESLKVYLDNYSYNNTGYYMAPGRNLGYYGSLTKNTLNTVNFNRKEMPIALNVYRLTTLGAGKTTYHYPYVFLNGELYATATSVSTQSSVACPYNIPDGSVIRIMNTKNTGTATYLVEDGINVDIFQDVQKVGNITENHTLAIGTMIKVVPTEGYEDQEYVVYRNDVKMSNQEAAQGFAVSNAQETLRIEKPRNVLTFTANGTTDLTKLIVSDSEGNTHSLSSTQNVLQLAPTIESMTILTSEEDHYISDVVSDPSSMKYDVNTGILTDLTTGTLNVITKQIEREQEVSIYVDGGQMEGVEITLGSGKQIETGQSLGSGTQTVQFGAEDLPIILKLPDSYLGEDGSVPADPSQMPTVMVNGEVLPYSPEHNGYVFPEEAFADPSNPPVIKIYPAEPTPAEVTFLVEPGVTFSAVPDGEEDKTITEAGTAELLPGTNVTVSAKSIKSNEEIFIVADNETVADGADVSYTFQVRSEGQSIEIKRKKVAVTLNSDEAWRYVQVSGGGFNYPLYDESSELEFPMGTSQLTLRSSSDTQKVMKVINATTGSEMTFDHVSGVVSGVTDGMKLSLEMGDLNRDNELTIYLEESENVPHTTLKIAEGTAVEKEIWLQSGYQKMMFGAEDLPMAVNSEQPLKVYLNNTLLDYDETDGYRFPAEIPANSVVKVFTAEQPVIKVSYDIEGPAFDVEVLHDHVSMVDTSLEHSVLPGTEIILTVEPKTLEVRLMAARKAETPASEVNGNTEVTVNGEKLEAGEDGRYSFKVSGDHADTGLSFVVKRPDYVDPETGCVYSADRTTLISVSPDAEGHVTILPGVTTIAEGAFKDCDKVTSVELPESLETIEKDAFSGCTSLTEIVVPNNVTTVGEGAFNGCSNLQTVILGSSVESVAEDAFTGCTNLTKSAYPQSLGESPFPAGVPAVAYTVQNPVVDENGYIYSEEDGNKTLIFVPATVSGTVVVPEDVTAIGADAFVGCNDMTTVIVSDNVTEIGAGAFSGCEALETVVIGAGVETIDPTAFENCDKIAEAIYPSAVKDQVAGSFPETAVNIPYTASGLEVGEDGVITGKPAEGEGKVLVYAPDDVISEEGTYTIPDDITEIGSSAFTGCDNLKDITIPDTVEKIDEGAFSGCDNLTNVDLGNGVKEIGNDAFSGTGISNITIPESVTSIGDGAFSDCGNLTELVIPDTVESLGEGVMSGCENLTTVTIPEGVEEIGAGAFEGCTNLETIVIPETVTSIGENAFNGCTSLTGVTIPETVTEIGAGAFEGCTSLENVNIPEGVTTVGDNAFHGCTSLTDVTIPETVTEIGAGAFEGCTNLENVNIPEGVTTIGNNAFSGCTSLETIDIPENVTTIGDGAFQGCENLTTVAIPPTVETVGSDAFAGCTNLDKCVYPDTLTEPFGSGVGISYPADEAVVTENGVILTQDAIYFVPADVTEVQIPETVSEIMPNAFKDCKDLTSVELPDGLTTIGEESFSGCTSLTGIEVPNLVTEIENGAFNGCTSLAEVNLGSSVTSIGENAFDGCSSLHEIDIHSNVTTIGANAFRNCDLTALHIGAGITQIGANAFAGNHLSEIAITAQTAPSLGENALGENAGASLFVQGSAAADSYKDAAGWNSYAPTEMVVATDIVSPDPKEYKLKSGDVVQLHASVQPTDAKLGAIFWESSNPAVATVDHTGKVTMGNSPIATFAATGNGETTITARTMYANGPVLNFTIKDTATGINDMPDDELRSGSLDRLIGTAEIYTLSGLKITADTKHLEPGVYIVKYKGKTYKIDVN